jgi:predicted HNH restriction endonuclease
MSKSWIFQGNPKRFDVLGYLEDAGVGGRITWTVSRYRDEYAVGDTVYVWLAGEKSGVVARAIVEGIPSSPEGQSAQRASVFDIAGSLDNDRWTIPLKIEKLANEREKIKRDWLRVDPLCRDMQILKAPQGTNFRLSDVEASRLNRLWNKTGSDWSDDECLAAIYLYENIWQGKISKKADSPVGETAVLIGRAVTGVYNKVMNIRHLDPRVEQEGLSGGGAAIQAAWDRYFNADDLSLDIEKIQEDLPRSWKANYVFVDPSEDEGVVGAGAEGKRRKVLGIRIERSKKLRDRCLAHWGYSCQVCDLNFEERYGAIGKDFIHVHHLNSIAVTGETQTDPVKDLRPVCPNCHSMLHKEYPPLSIDGLKAMIRD